MIEPLTDELLEEVLRLVSRNPLHNIIPHSRPHTAEKLVRYTGSERAERSQSSIFTVS